MQSYSSCVSRNRTAETVKGNKFRNTCVGTKDQSGDKSRFRGTDEGSKLKEARTTHWNSPNTGATNESGFTALPGGYRHGGGGYTGMGSNGYFWSSTESSSAYAWSRRLNYHSSVVHLSYYNKLSGLSVRCLRD
ncbi:MAG: hypothetical protein ISR95_08565 [Candidatus Marinimicrobia bacterium]|nr:hypothetical protein [Candidatus Neomarinimicrobiota bacterium]